MHDSTYSFVSMLWLSSTEQGAQPSDTQAHRVKTSGCTAMHSSPIQILANIGCGLTSYTFISEVAPQQQAGKRMKLRILIFDISKTCQETLCLKDSAESAERLLS